MSCTSVDVTTLPVAEMQQLLLQLRLLLLLLLLLVLGV
jgi:hypothetical protein